MFLRARSSRVRAASTAFAGVLALGFLDVALVSAQDLEPRAYSASPVGANFLVGSYSWSGGSVLFDPTLPIANVHADVQGFVVGAGHSFNLFGDLALVTAAIPYALAHVTGDVQEQAAEVDRSGLADARFKLSVNLRGNPAMTPAEFAAAPRRTIVGASISLSAPVGQYYETKLVNLGTHRWALKPEIGISHPEGAWTFDGYVGGWFFTDNQNFYPGDSMRTQDPVFALQAHVSYAFKPRLWGAFDATWYHGGSARVDDGPPSSAESNSRIGLTLSLPVGSRYSLKVAGTSGVVARTGTNFTTFAVAWQALWLNPRWSGR